MGVPPASIHQPKNTPTENQPTFSKGGGGNGGGGGSGNPSSTLERRLSKADTLLEELEQEDCDPDRWETLELLLDFFHGQHNITKLRDHLQTI